MPDDLRDPVEPDAIHAVIMRRIELLEQSERENLQWRGGIDASLTTVRSQLSGFEAHAESNHQTVMTMLAALGRDRDARSTIMSVLREQGRLLVTIIVGLWALFVFAWDHWARQTK